MRAVLYDCRDVGRGCTLRIFDESEMILQASMLGDGPVGNARRIAAGVEADWQYVGPPDKPRVVDRPNATLDPPAVYVVPAPAPPPATLEREPSRKQLGLFG